MKAFLSLVLLLGQMVSFVFPLTAFAEEAGTETEVTHPAESSELPIDAPERPRSDVPRVGPSDDDASRSGEEETTKNTPSHAFDPTKMLASFQGKQEVDLFSGALSYQVLILTPPGRGGVAPNLSLVYSSLHQSFGSAVGYGWSLPTNAIFRSPTQGVNTTYSTDEFSADIFGATNELVLVNAAEQRYSAKDESSFTSYTFDGDAWTAVDRNGTTYTFGSILDARQADPKNSTRVYKWLLERVEDTNGNAMIFTYASNGAGAIYPSAIFYGGTSRETAVYEVRFTRTDRGDYTDYKTGFSVTHSDLIEYIDVFLIADGTEENLFNYHLTYDKVNSAIQLISEITLRAPDVALPATEFIYYRGGENVEHKKLYSLHRIEEGQGATHEFVYTPSTAYRQSDGTSANFFPFTVYTVGSYMRRAFDGAPSDTTTYRYERGHYFADPDDAFVREYAGFGKVTITDPLDFQTINYYHQSETDAHNAENAELGEVNDHIAKKGRMYRSERYDADGDLSQVSVTAWQGRELADADEEHVFVYPSRVLSMLYRQDGTHADTAQEFVYDEKGNVLSEMAWGEVAVSDDLSFVDYGSDKRTTIYLYAVDQTGKILSAPSTVAVLDAEGNQAAKTLYTYDDLAFGEVSVGNVTKAENWISGSSFAASSSTYDAYGNPLTQTDPLGNTTTFVYDAYNFYPETITNALDHTKTISYDYATGQPTRVVEVNGAILEMDYDGFGRPMAERQSSSADAAVLVTTQAWDYNDASFPRAVTHKSYLSDTTFTQNVSYVDGFDRVIESKTLNEDATGYNEMETTYDPLGRVASSTLPEASTQMAYDANTVSSNLVESYQYDALSRLISVTNIFGKTKTSYDGFRKTVVDVLGNQKDYVSDGLGRLTYVLEYIDGAAYTTSYAWSAADKLTKITDALGNVRAFSYDGRGLRLTAEDLHAPSDATFGTWVYTYDTAGNLKTSLSPNGITTIYGYDALNRLKSEDASDATGVELTQTYDSCLNGTGVLCAAAVNGGATTTWSYDAAGNKASEMVTIDGAVHSTSYTHDRQGNILTTAHPDGTQVKNSFNALGKLETIQKKNATDANFAFVVSAIDYGPHGQVVTETNANGTATTSTYDEGQRYRLSRKVTMGFKKEVNSAPITTTERFYPTTGDGYSYKYHTSWDTAHDATAGSGAPYTSTVLIPGTAKYSSGSFYIYRTFLPFDTSSIPDGATITQAKLFVYSYSKKDNDNDGDDFVTVVQTSQANTASLSVEDFDQAGSINNPIEGIDASERKDLTAIATYAYLPFTLNATGREWVSKIGVTKLGLREGHDVLDSAFTSSSTTSAQYNTLYIRSAEYSGTTSDPYLEVTYTQPNETTTLIPITIQDLNYSYDAVGNITKIVDASAVDSAKMVDYTYDDLYRLTSETVSGAADGDNTTTTYTYNILGNILSRSDTGAYLYEGDKGDSSANPHAVTSIQKPDGTTITYTYDKNGNLISDGNTTYQWDEKNRLVSSTKIETELHPTTITNTMKFSPTASDGYVYKYNASWDTVHDAAAGSSAPYTGTSFRTGTGKTTSAYYINRSFLPFDTSSLPDDATIADVTLRVFVSSKYNHDNDGDDFITVVQTSQANTTSLTLEDYDQVGAINNPTEGIDPGQRKDLTAIPLSAYLPFTLNATGRDWVSKIGVTKLGLREGHDVLDSAFTSSSSTSSQYNYLNVLSSEYSSTTYDPSLEVTYTQTVENPEPTTKTVIYAYDHGMRRVAKKSETETTYYPSDEYALTGDTSTVYISGPSGLAASIETNPLIGSESSTIHTDHLGSTSVVTDEQGVVKELLDYHAYGTERINWSSSDSGEAETQRTYIGEYADDESGLSYLNARYYDAGRGMFLSEDAVFVGFGSGDKRDVILLLDPQMQNSYLYGRGNPLAMKDSSGELAFFAIVPYLPSVVAGLAALVSTPALQSQVVDGFSTLANQSSSLAAKAWAGIGVGTSLMVPGAGKATEWGLSSFARGRALENIFGANLGWNFPVIDKFVNGVATSIKSLDLNAKSYQNMGALGSKLKGYVDDVAGFARSEPWSGFKVPLDKIQAKELQVIIPKGSLTNTASKVFQKITDYAKNLGVDFKFTEH